MSKELDLLLEVTQRGKIQYPPQLLYKKRDHTGLLNPLCTILYCACTEYSGPCRIIGAVVMAPHVGEEIVSCASPSCTRLDRRGGGYGNFNMGSIKQLLWCFPRIGMSERSD